MTPRTLTAPPTDRRLWRRLLALVHPDGAGDHELFIWTTALFDHVAGDHIEDARTPHEKRQPPKHPTAGDRLDFTAAHDLAGFDALTAQALRVGEEAGEPFARLLRLLADCSESTEIPLSRQQQQGATYRTLAAVAYAAGLDTFERTHWYRIAESIPLSQRHAGHLLSRLKRRAA